jgi:prepilin-type processing-associated H-X9-DG protein
MSPRCTHRGVTLADLMVTILIIGVMFALLVPLLNQNVCYGRRAQCQNNMKNVILAIIGYVNDKNRFPPAGMFMEDAETLAFLTPGSPTFAQGTGSVIPAYLPGQKSQRGVAMYSWAVAILDQLDNQELLNQWTMFADDWADEMTAVPYDDPTVFVAGQASNLRIAATSLKILQCPDDNTFQPGQGNLSYVVNGGFALWHADPHAWAGSPVDGGGKPGPPMIWAPGGVNQVTVTQKLGVMFTESTFPPGLASAPAIPWNVKSSLASIADGTSHTILLSENTLTGAGANNQYYSFGRPTNWACPFPTFTSFIGSTEVCAPTPGGSSYDCTAGAGKLQSTSGRDGPEWSRANDPANFENINGGQKLTIEGQYPFSNSAHPGGVNVGFCDGAVRFIISTIDGTVYSKIITPAGSKLPLYCKQLPLQAGVFIQ